MIHWNRNLFLIWRRRLLIRLRPLAKAGPVRLRLVKQRDVIRGGGFEAVPHLPGRVCVILGGFAGGWGWRRKRAVSSGGSFASCAGRGPRPGTQAAAAPPPPGAAEGPLMPAPGGGGSGPGRGLGWGRAGGLRPSRAAGGAGRPDTSPPRPPAGRRRRRRPRGCRA